MNQFCSQRRHLLLELEIQVKGTYYVNEEVTDAISFIKRWVWIDLERYGLFFATQCLISPGPTA